MIHLIKKPLGASKMPIISVFRDIHKAKLAPVRLLSTRRALLNKGSHSEKSSQQPQSILTDDMLARAGVDLEANNTAARSSTSAEDDAQSGDGKAGTGRKRKHRKTSTEVKRERYANLFYIFSLTGLVGTAAYMCRDWDLDEPEETRKDISNGYTPQLMYARFKARFQSIFTFMQEPPFPDLLPPPPPPPYQRPLTLILPLEDFLVHSEWTQKDGWRTAKRPGTDYFLGYLSQYYEIVLFSSNYMVHSEKIAEKLDPIHAFVTYNLYKDHCLYKDGIYIKDLSHLNRDLGKTIIIDTDPNAFKLQPENAIHAKPWNGTADGDLVNYIPFLEYLVTQQTNDIRPILNSFKDRQRIPEEFAKRVARLREKFNREQQAGSQQWTLKLLGIGVANKQAKFPLDMIREEGEKNYVRFMKLIEEEKEKLKLQQETMGGHTFTIKDYVAGNIPSPEEQMRLQLEKQKEFEEIYEKRKKEKEEKQKQQEKLN